MTTNTSGHEGDAALASALQSMEDNQAAQTAYPSQQIVVMVPQQVQMMSVQGAQTTGYPQQEHVVNNVVQPPTGTSYKDWYFISIKDKRHNRCSCSTRSPISAYFAIFGWLTFDLVHVTLQLLVWFAVVGFHEQAEIFGALFLIIGISDVLAWIGVIKYIKSLIIIKFPFFIATCIMVLVELILLGTSGILNSGFDLIAIFYLVLILIFIGLLILTYFAMKDLNKIYKWMKYYEQNGPFTLMLP
eukprot:209985_1